MDSFALNICGAFPNVTHRLILVAICASISLQFLSTNTHPTHRRLSVSVREADVPRLLPYIPAATVMLPWLRVDDPLWIGESRRVSVLAVRIGGGGNGGDGGDGESIALAAASLEVHACANEYLLRCLCFIGERRMFFHFYRQGFLISFFCRHVP